MRNKLPAGRNIGIEIDNRVVETWNTQHPLLCELVQGDALEYLRKFAYDGGELIYADPPYLKSTRRRQKIYRHEYDEEQHSLLLEFLKSVPCQVMISGYDSELYNQVLCSWQKVSFPAKTHADVRMECLWMNFQAPSTLHDARHMGNTFRDRQTIKRRRTRAQNRIQQMDPIERNELIQWINREYGDAK